VGLLQGHRAAQLPDTAALPRRQQVHDIKGENAMKSSLRLISFPVLLCLAAFVLLLSAQSAAQPPLPGNIFTTDSTCSRINQNLFTYKTDVYLNGGPQHSGSAGLPDGSYYVQVTDPSGATLLGTSVGSINPTPFVVVNGAATSCLRLWDFVFNGGAPGYIDTPNAGGEYKVWVSTVSTFDNNSTKTDNFKVSTSQYAGDIIGTKFYDANVNGVLDSGELGIPNWRITLFGISNPLFTSFSTTTDVNGNYLFDLDTPGTYGVCEVLPSASPIWINTTPIVVTGLTLPPNPQTANFGNVCLGSGGGLTLGFWSNKNGQGLVTAADLCTLNSLNLVFGNGTAFDPVAGCSSPTNTQVTAGKTNLRNWLLSANATNMAYMLSAQLTSMELNVMHGFVSSSQVVYAPGTGLSSPGGVPNFATIGDLMAAANNSLASSPNTTTAGPARTLQEALKNALDKANNNQNFVQSQACDVNYSVVEPSCIPAQ
jgi:SdrD B-like protein